MLITPYYASLIRMADFSDPIYAQCVPQEAECESVPWLGKDPLEEQGQSPVEGMFRRYPDRALVLASRCCAVKCRHCMRRRIQEGAQNEKGKMKNGKCNSSSPILHSSFSILHSSLLDGWCSYLRSHPEIKEVLISGGDPLLLETRELDQLLARLRAVRSVEILRIATRIPVVLPQRITAHLAHKIARHAPVYLNTHFNHPREVTPEAERALALLANAGIPLGNQTVLLRGVNDDPLVIEDLCRRLLRNRVRPYYLFQCDLVEGTEHFRTPLKRGLDIMAHLRGRLSGLAIPHFALDTPAGGKVELLPETVVEHDGTHTLLRTPTGKIWDYPEPSR